MSRALLVLLLARCALAQVPDWENPAVFERHRESPRASFVPYETVEAGLELRPGALAEAPVAERAVAVSLVAETRREARRFHARGFRRERLGRRSRSRATGSSRATGCRSTWTPAFLSRRRPSRRSWTTRTTPSAPIAGASRVPESWRRRGGLSFTSAACAPRCTSGSTDARSATARGARPRRSFA